jgi:DNA-directed RNA polymerase I subunit RPA1
MNSTLRHWLDLQNHVNNLIDNKENTSNTMPPGIKQLLEKKAGLFRKHMMVRTTSL